MRRGARRCADQQPRLSQRMDTVKETLAKRQAPYAQDVCAHRENTANGPEASGSRAAGVGRAGRASGLGVRRSGRAGARPHTPSVRFTNVWGTSNVGKAHTRFPRHGGSAGRRFFSASFLRHVVPAGRRFYKMALPQHASSAARRFCGTACTGASFPHRCRIKKVPPPQRGTGLHAHE